MPIFEYRCVECGHQFEEIIHGDRNQVLPCPQCGSTSTEKCISLIGGISMGKSANPSCGSSCPGTGRCGMAAEGGCCHH